MEGKLPFALSIYCKHLPFQQGPVLVMLSSCLDPGYLYSISEWTIPQKEIRESNQSYVLYACRATTYIKSNCFYPGSLFGSFQINEWTIPQKEMTTVRICTAFIYWTNNRTVSIRVPFFGSFRLDEWTIH
jgi:hypothetical protein